ncbi:MAG: hypothetical protein ACR2ND_13625 [Solirubrobacteraceae bacterium]
MPITSAQTTVNAIEGIALVTLLFAYGLALLVAELRRVRPDFRPGAPLAAGFALRLAALVGVSASGIGSSLRAGDETGFLGNAQQIASAPFSSGLWLPGGQYNLHVVLFALQMRLADLGPTALRVTQVGIAMMGLLLLAAAVHDLAGPRAARLVLWLLALEPASIFFSQILHKEPLMELASGLVAFGAARFWRRVDIGALAIMASGSAVAILTRPYAGWFLASGAVLVALHASLKRARQNATSFVIFATILAGLVAVIPVIVQVTSHQSLQQNLQSSQNANTQIAASTNTSGNANGDNLALESVDYSTRGAIITNLPTRIRDLLLRPYPWQVANASERLGVFGTLAALATLFWLLRYALRRRGDIVQLTAPLLYPIGFLMIAYALSVGNAGTGFRYRSHLITLALAILVVLREHTLARAGERDVDPHGVTGRQVALAYGRPNPRPLAG